jgi:COMPASS component SWD1
VWDVLTSDAVAKWRFATPIMKVQFNPRNDDMLLICPMKHAAVTVMVPAEGAPQTADTHTVLPLDDDTDYNITASFDGRGQYVYTGNAKGRITVIKLDDSEPTIVASFRVANTAIKQIEFAPKRKECFLVNTSDRVIRVYECSEVMACGINGEPEPVQKLQDLVNKTMWKKCCFSGGPDADYICAGSARQHSLYIWERSVGTLVKILHGTKGELLLDVEWHPLRPIIASISSGVVSIWAQAQVENWSAFAPDFKELDENVDYEERESEFDVADEDRSPARVAQDNDDEDVEVDVTTSHPTAMYLSSDEDDEAERNDLVYLPVTLEIDEPEQLDGPLPFQPPTQPGASTKQAKKVKPVEIVLQDIAKDEVHPILAAAPKPRPDGKPSFGKPGRPPLKRSSGPGPSSDTIPKRKKKYFSDDY